MKREKNVWLYSIIFSFFIFPLVVLSPRERILEEGNYITVKYGKQVVYGSWIPPNHHSRGQTSKLNLNGSDLGTREFFRVQANEELKIYINDNVESLESFFDASYDICLSDVVSVDFSNFKSYSLKNLKAMFYGCRSLVSLDLSNFDTSNVTDMSYMFYDCSILVSLDLSNFETSNVNNMQKMFFRCTNLVSLDISNFDTSSVTDMSHMFFNCYNLSSLDISNFDTSNVNNMMYMFEECTSLVSLNLSNFDTSKVNNMTYMFSGCTSLISLD